MAFRLFIVMCCLGMLSGCSLSNSSTIDLPFKKRPHPQDYQDFSERRSPKENALLKQKQAKPVASELEEPRISEMPANPEEFGKVQDKQITIKEMKNNNTEQPQ